MTGSRGLIGSALVRRLESAGHEVLRLVRPDPGAGGARYGAGGSGGGGTAEWDPDVGRLDPAVLDGVDGVVHLAGAGIGDKRWNDAYKTTLLESRVSGTRTVAGALAELAASGRPVPVLVSGSAIGYYGIDRGADTLTEQEPPGFDFLARLCVAWEEATEPARAAGARVVCLRTGLVLSAAGGVLARLLLPFRLGLGGPIGSGRQYQSWVTRDDEVSAIVHALESPEVEGPLNVAAPTPVTNAELARALGRALHRPAVLPLPAPALRLAFGREMAEETILAGQRVVPARLEATGFRFGQPDLDGALRVALDDRRK